MAEMTTGPDTPTDTLDILRAIEAARESGLSQASGAGFATKLDPDDQSNPDQALADNPDINVSGQLGMAAFDLAVRGAISAKFGVQIQNKQFNDEFSMTGGEGSLREFFEARFEATPEEKKKKETEEALRDAIENAQERRRERDRMETMSQRDLDAMEWEGDSSTVWNFGSLSGSRKDIYKWAKATRGKLDKLSEENGWTENQRAREERLLSDFMKATKAGDEAAAKQAWEDMKPETQQEINLQSEKGLKVGQDISTESAAAASDIKANASTSTLAGSDVLEAAAFAESASVAATSRNKEAALLNPPDVKLTEEFSLAAADKPATPVSEQQLQLQLASVAATPKAAAPVLSQEFSI